MTKKQSPSVRYSRSPRLDKSNDDLKGIGIKAFDSKRGRVRSKTGSDIPKSFLRSCSIASAPEDSAARAINEVILKPDSAKSKLDKPMSVQASKTSL